MPKLKYEGAAETEEFIFAALVDAVKEDSMTVVKVERKKIILTRHNGVAIAVDSICPHAAADLSKGSLRSWQICCHEHDYCFDIRNGRIVWPEDEVYRLRRYETKEENGQVMVRLTRPI